MSPMLFIVLLLPFSLSLSLSLSLSSLSLSHPSIHTETKTVIFLNDTLFLSFLVYYLLSHFKHLPFASSFLVSSRMFTFSCKHWLFTLMLQLPCLPPNMIHVCLFRMEFQESLFYFAGK